MQKRGKDIYPGCRGGGSIDVCKGGHIESADDGEDRWCGGGGGN